MLASTPNSRGHIEFTLESHKNFDTPIIANEASMSKVAWHEYESKRDMTQTVSTNIEAT